MRWFKHLSAASEDEKLAEIIEIHGIEGYGAYWIILEKIAIQMEKGSDKTWARYSVKKWGKFLGKSPKVFRKFLETFEKLSLFSSEICENNSEFLKIDCPNLLKYRDEYSKKSGQTPDPEPTNSDPCQEQDRETDTDTEVTTFPQKDFAVEEADDEQEEIYITRKGRQLRGKRFETFHMFWEAFNYKVGKAEAADAWLDIPLLTDKMVQNICAAAKNEAEGRQEKKDRGSTPIYPQGWISGKRWEDEKIPTQTNKSPTMTAIPGSVYV